MAKAEQMRPSDLEVDREVNNVQSILAISFGLANRSMDTGGLVESKNTEQLAAALKDQIITTLDEGKLLVMDASLGGLDASVTGILRKGKKLHIETGERFSRKNTDTAAAQQYLSLKEPTIDVAVVDNHELRFMFSEEGEENQKKCFVASLPLEPAAGQHIRLMSAKIDSTKNVYPPARFYSEHRLIHEQRIVDHELSGKDVIKKYEYTWKKQVVESEYPYTLTISSNHPQQVELLAALGIIHVPHSFIQPSGWHVTEESK